MQENLNPLTIDVINAYKDRNEEFQQIGDKLHSLLLQKIKDESEAGQITGLIVAMQPSEIIPLGAVVL